MRAPGSMRRSVVTVARSRSTKSSLKETPRSCVSRHSPSPARTMRKSEGTFARGARGVCGHAAELSKLSGAQVAARGDVLLEVARLTLVERAQRAERRARRGFFVGRRVSHQIPLHVCPGQIPS